MAEYYIAYNELADILDGYIQKIDREDEKARLLTHKAEILSAITFDFDNNNPDAINGMVTLWQNQLAMPSQLVLGTHYICVQSAMLNLLATMCSSGLLDAVITMAKGTSPGILVSVVSGVVLAVWQLINSVKKLDDSDFCIYMQALTHAHVHDEFTKESLIGWFPGTGSSTCNIEHRDQWNCNYYRDSGACDMVSGAHIDEALESLCNKCILVKRRDNGQYKYKFNV